MKPFDSVEEMTNWICDPVNGVSGAFAFIGGNPPRRAVFFLDEHNNPKVLDHIVYMIRFRLMEVVVDQVILGKQYD
jgi:hypothetical protein